jgi:hypothetical protein
MRIWGAPRYSGSKVAAVPPLDELKPPDGERFRPYGRPVFFAGVQEETFEPAAKRARGAGPGPGGRGSVVCLVEEEEPGCSATAWAQESR